MALSTFRASVAIGLVVAPLALLGIACSRPPEQQFLTQFFRAARARDNNTISMMSAVAFNPREKGEVSSFEITNVSEERRSPLDMKPLMDAVQQAEQAAQDLRSRKIEFRERQHGRASGDGQDRARAREVQPRPGATEGRVGQVERRHPGASKRALRRPKLPSTPPQVLPKRRSPFPVNRRLSPTSSRVSSYRRTSR